LCCTLSTAFEAEATTTATATAESSLIESTGASTPLEELVSPCEWQSATVSPARTADPFRTFQ
jgi:hypothetical protein